MQPENIFVSMVVDHVEDHAYKADLLIRTLGLYANIPPARIFVHCVNRVPESVIRLFAEMGCRTRIIEPFLNQTFCNKIQQTTLVHEVVPDDVPGFLLLDVDVAVAGPFNIPDTERVWGKIVDGPNPPIDVLAKLFQMAEVTLPEVVQSDWNDGETFDGNFNGGVLYIPARPFKPIAAAWRAFAALLYAKSRDLTFIDQVAFALALHSTNVPYAHLSANSNFPTHSATVPRTYDPTRPIQALHYHWELDDFGFKHRLRLPRQPIDPIDDI